MAIRGGDQFRGADVTFWGLFTLVVWGVAVLGANIAAFVPDSALAGLHASRLARGNLEQMRGDVADLQSQAARLQQENAVLLQRFVISEQLNGDMVKRVGALESALPKVVESTNRTSGTSDVDDSVITADIGRQKTTTIDADGGSVSFTTTPFTPQVSTAGAQPMPQVLQPSVAPDSSAFGIALGAPIDASQGPATWQALNSKVGTLLIGLGPLLGNVEGGPGKRLVAGPIASEADARELCGRMAKVGIACSSVPFLGEPL